MAATAPTATPAQPATQPTALDRSALLQAVLDPTAPHILTSVLIAAVGTNSLVGELDVPAVAANLGVSQARVRSWLRRVHDDQHAAALLRQVLALRYGDTGVDTTAAAADLGVHPSTVRRWIREPVDAPTAGDVLHRLLAATTPRPASAGRAAVDVAAAAAALSVSTSTVRRWLSPASSPEEPRPRVPRARAEALLELTAPSAQVLTRETLDIQHARECIHRLQLGRGRGGMNAQYASIGWLEPHIVSVLAIPGTGLRRVAVTRVSTRPLQRVRQDGEVVDFTTQPLPHKFAATLLRYAVLDAVAGWRAEARPGAVEALAKGRTQTWVDEASLPSLDTLARRGGLT